MFVNVSGRTHHFNRQEPRAGVIEELHRTSKRWADHRSPVRNCIVMRITPAFSPARRDKDMILAVQIAYVRLRFTNYFNAAIKYFKMCTSYALLYNKLYVFFMRKCTRKRIYDILCTLAFKKRTVLIDCIECERSKRRKR